MLLGAALLQLLGVFTAIASIVGVVAAGFALVGGAAAGIAIAAFAAGVAIAVFWTDIQAGAAATWQFIQDGAAVAWGAIVQGATDVWAQIVGAFQAGQQFAGDAFNAVVAGIIDLWTAGTNRLGEIATAGVNLIVNAFSGLQNRIAGIWNAIADTASAAFGRIGSFIDNMISRISAAIARLKELVGLGNSAGSSGGGGTQGFAGGGSVRGPGGPKTDSILARLSAGEFVVQASIVKRLGVDFFLALNGGLLPSMKGLRGFSTGGFADGLNRSMSQMSIPRFAGGGSVAGLASRASSRDSGKTPINLNFPGFGVFPVLADNDVAASMQRVAIRSGLVTTGRKPLRG